MKSLDPATSVLVGQLETHVGMAGEAVTIGGQSLGPPSQLPEILYWQVHARRFGGTVRAPPGFTGETHLKEALQQVADVGWYLEESWKVERIDARGRVEAWRDGDCVVLAPGQYLAPSTPRPGAFVHRAVPTGAADRGYHVVTGRRHWTADDAIDQTRFYLHVALKGAVALMATLPAGLDHRRWPFRFKLPLDPGQYDRVDTGVLYVPRRYEAGVRAWLVRHASGLGLERGTPPFTLELAPGLALAQDPTSGESFGQHRMRLLAAALVAHLRGGIPLATTLVRHLDGAGLDPERPWLDAGTRAMPTEVE